MNGGLRCGAGCGLASVARECATCSLISPARDSASQHSNCLGANGTLICAAVFRLQLAVRSECRIVILAQRKNSAYFFLFPFALSPLARLPSQPAK